VDADVKFKSLCEQRFILKIWSDIRLNGIIVELKKGFLVFMRIIMVHFTVSALILRQGTNGLLVKYGN